MKQTPKPANKVAQKKSPESGAARSLKDLFEDGLKDMYWAENALTKALPNMFDNATDVRLKTAIKEHLDQTHDHVARLEQVFEAIGAAAEGKKCDAMEGLIKEGESIIAETQPGPVRDAGIIAAAQKTEHYEIASYGTLSAFAKTLNEREALDILLKTLGEEKKANMLLSAIADTTLNSQAVNEDFQAKKVKSF